MKNQHFVALAILIGITAWMFVPRAEEPPAPAMAPATVSVVAEGQTVGEEPNTFTVRAKRIGPEPFVQQIRVRGRTQAFRHVEVRAEQSGRIVKEPVPRGARVNAGDLLCEIAVDDRDSALIEARSRVEQAQFEYEAALDLQARDLQSDVIVAQLKATLESAKAGVVRAELALRRTKIVAPFAGVVEMRDVELGDLLNAGTTCASVLDDSPMLLVGLVPEQQVGYVAVGAEVTASLLTGETVTGKVRYLSRAADAASRSYRLEVEIDPSDVTIREGITAEIFVAAEESTAHLIPASALTIDDRGDVGVKLVNEQDVIEFQVVEIVGDYTNQLDPGVYVDGINGYATLVTHGQEIVFPGQKVNSNFDWDN